MEDRNKEERIATENRNKEMEDNKTKRHEKD